MGLHDAVCTPGYVGSFVAPTGRIQTPTTAREPAIPASLDVLETSIETAIDAIGELISRLDPVMRPSEPEACEGNMKTPEVRSTIDERIVMLASRVNTISGVARRAIKRLDV